MFKKSFYYLAVTVFVFTIMLSTASANINDQMAQLDIDTATLNDIIAIFGEPTSYKWGSKTYTRGELPVAVYGLQYPNNFFIVMTWNSVNEVRFESSALGYIWTGGIHVGSSLNDVLSVVGQPTQTVVGQASGFIDGVLYKDINGTVGYCYYSRSDQNVRFFFSNYNVAALYLMGNPSPNPIPNINEFDDVRSVNLSQCDFSTRLGLIPTLTFNNQTIWPSQSKMPAGCTPNEIMNNAKNPGLGVRQLHQQGITGLGVNVAIIDQPLYLDHPEYNGKIAAYYDTGCGGEVSSMHGPAVASLLVGTNCGTAPGARIYYVATPSWLCDAAYLANGLDWIIAQNDKLPVSEKIRVVSVSAAPSGSGSPFTLNRTMWDEACSRADAAGILVLDCTSHHGFIGSCWYDSNNPEDVTKCTPGWPGQSSFFDQGHILAPTSVRTTAQHYDYQGLNSYIYWGHGGLSWAIPYCTGVLAMGWQINPKLTGEQMCDLLFESAYTNAEGAKIINPQAFIDLVAETRVIYVGSNPEYDFNSIQSAINAASDDYTIIVQSGTYEEDVNFSGKNIKLKSSQPSNPAIAESTIINGNVYFLSTENSNCELAGFKITGVISGSSGGINHTQAAISHCILQGNCVLRGTVIQACDGIISNCLIADNYTSCWSIGPALDGCHGVIRNCTIANNHSAIGVWDGGTTTVKDSIIYHNEGLWPDIELDGTSTINISFCDIEDGSEEIYLQNPNNSTINWGTGNIMIDPFFVRLGQWTETEIIQGDYHLKSYGWRWADDESRLGWDYDEITSRCIDAGNPGVNLCDELASVPLDPDNEYGNNIRIEMGAYGQTCQASIAPYDWSLLADITNDGIVSFNDFAGIAGSWMEISNEQPSDFNRDGMVNLTDLSLFANNWLQITIWY